MSIFGTFKYPKICEMKKMCRKLISGKTIYLTSYWANQNHTFWFWSTQGYLKTDNTGSIHPRNFWYTPPKTSKFRYFSRSLLKKQTSLFWKQNFFRQFWKIMVGKRQKWSPRWDFEPDDNSKMEYCTLKQWFGAPMSTKLKFEKKFCAKTFSNYWIISHCMYVIDFWKTGATSDFKNY